MPVHFRHKVRQVERVQVVVDTPAEANPAECALQVLQVQARNAK